MPGVDFHLATLRKVRTYLPDWALKEIHSRAFAKSGGKARWRTGEAERYGSEQISKEYLEATFDVVSENRGLIPTWLFNRLHAMAFPSSGGIAKARKYKEAKAKESLVEPLTEQNSTSETGNLEKSTEVPSESEKEGVKKEAETQSTEANGTVGLWKGWIKEELAKGAEIVGGVESDDFRCLVSETTDGMVHVLSEETVKIGLKPKLPLTDEDMPRIAFINGSPDPLEVSRGEAMVGVHGRAFKEQYLDPLGLEKREVALFNVVPVVLKNQEGGYVRGPHQSEISKWLPWLNKELESFNPDLTIAVGRTAANAIQTDFVLPHPKALTKSSRAELARKIRQIQGRLIDDGSASVAAKAAARAALSKIQSKIQTKTERKKGAKRGPLYKADAPYNFSHTFGLLSADDDANRLVTGVVYKPNELDTQREWMSPDELDKAANWWMEKSQASGKRHVGLAEARVTQSYIAPQDLRIGNKLVKAGSWIVTLHVLSKKLWADIKNGVYKGFSMGGYVTRIPGSLPPGLKIANPSTVNELRDAQPLEVSFVKSAANKEPEYLLLKCALCSG